MEDFSMDAEEKERYYVIQVAPRAEAKTEALIRARLDAGLYGRCFHPLRHVRKKFRGQWRDMHEKLIPGYVFLTAPSALELYEELRRVPALTKLLGKNDGNLFVPLSPGEAQWLEKMTAGGSEAELSFVSVSEGDKVTVVDGPLKDLEGHVKKINLHRRIAEVEVDFMGRKTVIHLGIELVGKESVSSGGKER